MSLILLPMITLLLFTDCADHVKIFKSPCYFLEGGIAICHDELTRSNYFKFKTLHCINVLYVD